MDADKDCYTDGKIAHELLHAYGLYHEHLRPDRSDYIHINYDNIRDLSKNVAKFKKMDHLPTYGVPYDGRSLMHYSSMYLSNGNGPTMESVNFPEMSVVLFGKLAHIWYLKPILSNTIKFHKHLVISPTFSVQ